MLTHSLPNTATALLGRDAPAAPQGSLQGGLMPRAKTISVRLASRLKRELLLRMFPRDWVSPRGHALAHFHKPENSKARKNLRESNVWGLGIGVKETAG